MRKMLKSKTFWAAILQFITAVIAWIMGEIELWAVILDFVAMLGIIFYRSSIDAHLREFLDRFNWFKSKTVWAALASIVGLVIAWLTGQMEFMQMVMAVVSAFMMIFMRTAVSPE